MIWRELLFRSIEKREFRFRQKDLAQKFGFSTSTIFQALEVPRKMGSVRVTGRFFEVNDPEKILYHWASQRRLYSELQLDLKIDLPVFEIEGLAPPSSVFSAYSAARFILGEPPADYSKVYIYHKDPEEIKRRFSEGKTTKEGNLYVLKPDPFLKTYGQVATIAQTFVDLWNLSDWYAKDFSKAIKEKIDELLS